MVKKAHKQGLFKQKILEQHKKEEAKELVSRLSVVFFGLSWLLAGVSIAMVNVANNELHQGMAFILSLAFIILPFLFYKAMGLDEVFK